MQSHKIKKGGNSNLIDCNAIVQNKKKGGNSNLIDCNAIMQNIFMTYFSYNAADMFIGEWSIK
jgi:hypothetical protein